LRATLPSDPICYAISAVHASRGSSPSPVNKVVEDAKLAVEGFDELVIRLNPHDRFLQHVMPAEDIHTLGYVKLTLQLRRKRSLSSPESHYSTWLCGSGALISNKPSSPTRINL
jgi:hypothetical protein